MIEHDGFYWIPILPKEMQARMTCLPLDPSAWPDEFRADYRRLSSRFEAARRIYHKWVVRDRDKSINPSAKLLIGFLLDRLEFNTGQCDPSHKEIADELGLSERSVERLTAKIGKWVEVRRRGMTATDTYRMRVSAALVTPSMLSEAQT